MKIASTDLALQSEHSALSYRQSSESLRSRGNGQPDADMMPLASAIARISAAAREALTRPAAATNAPAAEAQAIEAAGDAIDNDPFLAMMRDMIEHLTGEKVRVFDLEAFSTDMRRVEVNASATRQIGEVAQSATQNRAGYGLEYDYHAVHEEFESTRFSAEGTIRTADGREISFELDLEMTRYYREETQVSVRAGEPVTRKDPLVVNFGGTAAQLAEQAGRFFRFDLDGDGEDEMIPLFDSGTGYLALDLNRNGLIDSGKELFGPSSGHGFKELARLDEDGNGWIDEGDRVFDKLFVWTPAAEGAGDLRSLADVGIGALGLAHVASPFGLRAGDNRDLGLVKSTGLYLTESGKAGNVQEIDLTV